MTAVAGTPGASPSSRTESRVIAAVTRKVGYPDKWKDYSGLLIGQSSYCENMMGVARWSFDDMFLGNFAFNNRQIRFPDLAGSE